MKIYFMGICGTAMGNAACMMKEAGHQVFGSDKGVYDPMKSVLENAGIEIHDGFSVDYLKSVSPDLVVVGNAVSRMNEEVEFLLNTRAYEFTSLADLISKYAISSRKCLVVSGTHGKTTTTSMAAVLLKSQDANTGYLIGGVPQDLESGSKLGGKNSPFVIEGDEYDTAFFDKRSKFIHYRPRVLIINNIEFDHADIFRDLTDVKRTFTHVRRIVAGIGAIVENADDANIASLEDTPWTKRIKVGFAPTADLKILNFTQNENGSSFDLQNEFKTVHIHWNLSAEYNARNAAMAIAGTALLLGKKHTLDLDISPLLGFKGVKRRQEVLYSSEKVAVVEDFGHHPTAVRNTILAMRKKYPLRKIFACFEPRSNTSRTNVFQDEFADALSCADRIFVGQVKNLEKVPQQKRIDFLKMAQKSAKPFAHYDDNQKLLADLKDAVKNESSSCVIFFSNGSFDSIQHSKEIRM